MGLSLPSWISFVSVGCEMPTRMQRPKSARSPPADKGGSGWKGRSDRFAQTLCDSECNLFRRSTGFDPDLLARGRVTPFARRACRSNSYLQNPKVGNPDFAAL